VWQDQDLGSSRLKSYIADILRQLTPHLNSVPNRLSSSGYTVPAGACVWTIE
jgi:hypothetical protein